jgi:transglutaminase-like putative cysteine protease
MRWAIVHRTEYRYATPAKDSFNQVRLQPMNTAEQTVERFQLNVSPAAKLHHYRDFYANVVHHFEIPEPHANLTIESAVQARTRAPQALEAGATVFPLERIGEAARSLRCHDFVNPSTYVDVEPVTWRLALDAINGATDTWQAAQAITRFVHGHLKYVSSSTSVHTHMQEVLAQRQGVCQDFAHVTLGLCRAVKIPALYVSGYLATEAASATHAWIEAFLPEIGWRGLDPTHNRQVDQTYLKIAVGRDYADVAPVSGHYKGTQDRKMDVSVQIETEAGGE